MAYDLVITNGTVVDGTGTPRRHADVAVSEGKIVELGNIKEGAKRIIDASDLIVTPGFVDPHTHFDAQIWWDPLVTASCWNGVTTVVSGNCGVGIAPCRPEEHDIVTWDLTNVEGIPFEVLSKGITWEWESFPQFLDAAAAKPHGINLCFLAPLTPFRRYVMGEASMERAASLEETARIKALLKEAVTAGAVGWSTSVMLTHNGYKARPLACRMAGNDEMKAYANALKELSTGAIEIALTKTISVVSDEEYALLDLLVTESGRPVTWQPLIDRDDRPEACNESLRKTEPLTRRGAIPQVDSLPLFTEFNLRRLGGAFASMPSWKAAFNRPLDEQMRLYRDPAFRQAFRKDLVTPQVFTGNWDKIKINEVGSPTLKSFEGKSVAEIARERAKDPLDTFLDMALEDNLQTQFVMGAFNLNEERVGKLIADPRTMIGLADGGAHVDSHDNTGYCTYVLGTWVRTKQVLSLEQAVKRITSHPASIFGLKDRGRLAPGMAADICIFDLNTIGSTSAIEAPTWRNDLPGGGRRLVWPPDKGIKFVIVNGDLLYENQVYTGALPGKVLHS